MAGEVLQQVVAYLQANPELTQEIKQFVAEKPEEARQMVLQLAAELGIDPEQVDMQELRTALAELD